MKVEITGRHVVITPAVRTYIGKRLRKFGRMLGPDASFHVIIDIEKQRHTAEIRLRSKLLELTGRGRTSDMYASILEAVEKIERQVLKQRAKIIEAKRQRARAQSVQEKSAIGSGLAGMPRERGDGISVVEEIDSKPRTVEEAALELEQSDYPFVIFHDIESGSVNVLYKRPNGSLTLIRT